MPARPVLKAARNRLKFQAGLIFALLITHSESNRDESLLFIDLEHRLPERKCDPIR